MNNELTTLSALRNILDLMMEGRGVSQSVVIELGRDRSPAKEAARKALLGLPIRASLGPLRSQHSEMVAMLVNLIILSGNGSVMAVAKSGIGMSATLERWVKAKESEKLEERVMRFRSYMVSGVLGAVAAMVATIGPLVGGFGVQLGGPRMEPAYLLLAAASMVAVSTTLLGMLLSGRNFLPNLLIGIGVFLIVGVLASPLASFAYAPLLGIK